MKKVTLIIIAVSLFLLPTSAICGNWTGNINLFMGAKQLEEDDWEPLDEQDEFGIMFDFKQEGWPVSIAIDLLSSSDEQTGLYFVSGYGTVIATLEGETSEFDLGFRKIWDGSPTIRPYIGGGIAMVSAEIKASVLGATASDDDNATGFWLGGGVCFTFAEHFNVGLDLRVTAAEVTLFGVEGEAGGTHAGVFVGYHW